MNQLLEVKGLKIAFKTIWGENTVVDKVDFHIGPKEIVAFVGESGCGKSVTALALTKILPMPPGRILGGEVWFNGKDLLGQSERCLRGVRGNDISYIFQEPSLALNPVLSVGHQIGEAVKSHGRMRRAEMKKVVYESLRSVRIPFAEERIKAYPHQLSGGMKQRVIIAMALACEPKLLIADEPTTSLDVTVQKEIMLLLRSLHESRGMSVLLTTHNLGIVRHFSHRVYVMYAGEIVEDAETADLFSSPKHPYTIALLEAMPRKKPGTMTLKAIEGEVPRKIMDIKGCRFANRCPKAIPDCRERHPELEVVDERTKVRCPYWK